MSITKSHSLFSIYLISFLLAFHVAIPTYINSSFLEQFLSEGTVGLIYTIASVLIITGFFFAPGLIRCFGNYQVIVSIIVVEIIASLGLVVISHPYLLMIAFIVRLLAIPFIYYLLDILLEDLSTNNSTGRVRGIYLTLANLAWIFAPTIGGLIITDSDYWKIYLASFVFLIPILWLLKSSARGFSNSTYKVSHMWQTITKIGENRDLRNIFLADFLLYFFYSWMTIYTPLYLHKAMNFSWMEIGTIFSVMLIPFVLVQIPLGRLADKKWGEKEILACGFIIVAIATSVLFFIPAGSSMWLWAAILFITRIGAGAIEIMCDTYFFKKVDAANTDYISIYRISYPLAYTLGPLVASAILVLFALNMSYLFLILGLIMLVGLRFSLVLRDTK